jgi:hypothetical protein
MDAQPTISTHCVTDPSRCHKRTTCHISDTPGASSAALAWPVTLGCTTHSPTQLIERRVLPRCISEALAQHGEHEVVAHSEPPMDPAARRGVVPEPKMQRRGGRGTDRGIGLGPAFEFEQNPSSSVRPSRDKVQPYWAVDHTVEPRGRPPYFIPACTRFISSRTRSTSGATSRSGDARSAR